MATVAVASFVTDVVEASDSTTAKTMSNTANIAGFAISDVSAASSTATAFSVQRKRFCSYLFFTAKKSLLWLLPVFALQ